MKKYKTLLFDIDDTVLDFKATELYALESLFKKLELDFNDESVKKYQEVNHGLWSAFERGEIKREDIFKTRFSTLFTSYNKEIDVETIEKNYREFLNEGHFMIDGADDLLKNLSSKYDIYAATNGVSITQYKRLKDSNLIEFFKEIFVSEVVGYQKPQKEFFDHIFNNLTQSERESTLMIGDSLTADILGGNQAGIDTCWYNLNNIENTTGIIPTYEIRNLSELYNIL